MAILQKVREKSGNFFSWKKSHGKVREFYSRSGNFFPPKNVREKSGNFDEGQGKIWVLNEMSWSHFKCIFTEILLFVKYWWNLIWLWQISKAIFIHELANYLQWLFSLATWCCGYITFHWTLRCSCSSLLLIQGNFRWFHDYDFGLHNRALIYLKDNHNVYTVCCLSIFETWFQIAIMKSLLHVFVNWY